MLLDVGGRAGDGVRIARAGSGCQGRRSRRVSEAGAFSFAAHRNNWGPLVVHTDTRVVRGRDTVVRGGLHCDS